jgi:hypothetical protein
MKRKAVGREDGLMSEYVGVGKVTVGKLQTYEMLGCMQRGW